ncbi:hypothetical protein KP509_12G063800 [Ceratopteris richardii]|uniref:Uncharacterized protein n=1 Tax=Ceratopteris richardii TaxID=49495 RepID=A0A8T2TM94_CERRI|nr:hypothetical protein KP509_12G063800 [Ceratopteris richardii]
MVPEAEMHFAALIIEEAARLKKQALAALIMEAEKEGLHAYLARPKVRGRPNPHFLKATVRGVEQAKRAAEVNVLWKRRARELELEERQRKKDRHTRSSAENGSRYFSDHHNSHSKLALNSSRSAHKESIDMDLSSRSQTEDADSCTLNDYSISLPHYSEEDYLHDYGDEFADKGLREEEMEHFLQSRLSAEGEQFETGPYPSPHCDVVEDTSNVRVKEEWEQRIIGPSKEIFERHLSIESKKQKKSKFNADELGALECAVKCKSKKKEKKKKKHKHRHSHKKIRGD